MHETKVNPFQPDEPIGPEFFVGRKQEIGIIDTALNQTTAGFPQDVLLLGEKWIGKSSLAVYAATLARTGKEFNLLNARFNSIYCRLGTCRTLDEICIVIINQIHRRIGNGARARLQKFLESIQGINIGFVGIQFDPRGHEGTLASTLPHFIEQLTTNMQDTEYDGLLIILDETEQVARIDGCASFFKNLLETLRDPSHHGRNRISFLFTATPEGFQALSAGHTSFPRLFRIAPLDRLQDDEVEELVQKLLKRGQPVCTL